MLFLLRRGSGSGLEIVNTAKILSSIPAIVISGIGVLFGLIAKVMSSKAQSEIANKVEKVGSILSILGIILNCGAIGLTIYNSYVLTFWPTNSIVPLPI